MKDFFFVCNTCLSSADEDSLTLAVGGKMHAEQFCDALSILIFPQDGHHIRLIIHWKMLRSDAETHAERR